MFCERYSTGICIERTQIDVLNPTNKVQSIDDGSCDEKQ